MKWAIGVATTGFLLCQLFPSVIVRMFTTDPELIDLLRHPDGKEKVCRHHLETDNRKDRKDDMQTVHRRLDQLGWYSSLL